MSWERALFQQLTWIPTAQRGDGVLNEVRTWHTVTGINVCVFLWISLGYNYEHMHLMMMMMMNLMLVTLYFWFIHMLRHFRQYVVIVLLEGTWDLFAKWNRKLLKNYTGFFKNVVTCKNGKMQFFFFFFNFRSELHNLTLNTGGYLITTSVSTVILSFIH